MPPIEFQQRLLERANAERSEKLRYRGVSYVPTKAVVVDPEYFGKKIWTLYLCMGPALPPATPSFAVNKRQGLGGGGHI